MATIFADNIFKFIFLNGDDCLSIHLSLKFVPKGPIDNTSASVQVMAWHQLDDKPLSAPMMA